MKKYGFAMAVVIPLVVILVSPFVMAEQFLLGGKPLNLYGYITQDVSFSLKNDGHFDNEGDLRSALFNFFVEGDYAITNNLKFYLSSMLTVDWVYELKHGDNSWNKKEFNKSRDELFVDDEFWQVLKEAHFTWTPGDFLFRVGKQIMVWGETDGFRLMDQINPLDQRRGFADVEFESTIIPIWLLRMEYYPSIRTDWMQDLGLEFTFNPNADFIPNQNIRLGNDKAGIWAPYIRTPFIGGPAYVGSAVKDIKEPTEFHPEGFEYAFRIKTIIREAIITVNCFYGRDNDPAFVMAAKSPRITVSPHDGRSIIHPFYEGRYPLLRFVGGTFTRDISPLKSSRLGGVAPVLRIEALYAFDSTFATTEDDFKKTDELRWAVGIDWKLRIPVLNPKRTFLVSTQFYHRHFRDNPSGYDYINSATGSNFEHPDVYQATLMIDTAYFLEKLKPSFFWMRDITDRGNFFRFQTIYEYSNEWAFTVGAIFLGGDRHARGFQPLKHKDYLYLKVAYKWG